MHQLSSTRDPIFSLTVPASRIVGGYTVKDGVIVPNYSHGEVIEAVFRRTRVTVGLMTSAKLLSAVEPVIRYQRGRFRGGEQARRARRATSWACSSKEDALHRLVDVWATGEAGASLGFAAARLFDELDPLETEKDAVLAGAGRRRAAAQHEGDDDAREGRDRAAWTLQAQPPGDRDEARLAGAGRRTRWSGSSLLDALANVLCPAAKLWNTGHGANMMREAVSLMGGYGITEDCPGFLGHKWMDAQLEATYEGPEAVQRRQLSVTMTNELFLAQFRRWIARDAPGRRQPPRHRRLHAGHGDASCGSGRSRHLQSATDADGAKLYHGAAPGRDVPAGRRAVLAAGVARMQILDVLELEPTGPATRRWPRALAGTLRFFTDLCHVQAARAAGEVGRICAELVYGYNRHPAWDEEARQACYERRRARRARGDHPGPRRRGRGTRRDRGRAPPGQGRALRLVQGPRPTSGSCGSRWTAASPARASPRTARPRRLTKVMIPEALDYPV